MLKADAGTLAATLAKVIPACERRNTIPILSCARLVTEAGVLTASCSNLDLQLDANALVEQAGPSMQIAADGRRLFAILRLLGKREGVELAAEEGRAILSWNGGRAALPTLPASDFPEMTTGGRTFDADLDPGVFESLARCQPFVSTQETRFYLTGVCLWPTQSGMLAIATNGSYLCATPVPALDGLAGKLDTLRPIVPHETVRAWLGLRGEERLRLRLQAAGQRLELANDGVRLCSRLIDGTFPSWERIVPDKRDMRPLTLARGPLLAALRMVIAGMAPKTADGVLLGDAGRLQVCHSFAAEAAIAADLGPYDGAPFELGINPHSLRQGVTAARGERVTLWLEKTVGAGHGPILVEGSDARPGDAIILMPLRWVARPSFAAPPLAEAA